MTAAQSGALPRRVQLRRVKGWRMPPNTVSVARPTKWGNPFKVADCIEAGFASDTEQARVVCVHAFSDWLNGNTWADGSGPIAEARRSDYLAAIPELRGKNLACWCSPDKACHADALLRLANV